MNPSSQAIFEMPLKVRDYEVDSQGIVNNANYLHYFEHTRHEFCDERGCSFKQMQLSGLDPVVNRIEVDYINPLRLSDVVTSRLWVERRGPRFLFHQEIVKSDGVLSAKAVISIVGIKDGKISRGDDIAAALGI